MTLDEALETVRASIRAAAEAIRDLPDEKLVELATIAARATGAPQRYAIADTDASGTVPGRGVVLVDHPVNQGQLVSVPASTVACTQEAFEKALDTPPPGFRPTAAMRAEKEVAEGAPRPTGATAVAKGKILEQLARGPKTRPELLKHVSSSGTLQHALTELVLEGSIRRPVSKRAPWSIA